MNNWMAYALGLLTLPIGVVIAWVACEVIDVWVSYRDRCITLFDDGEKTNSKYRNPGNFFDLFPKGFSFADTEGGFRLLYKSGDRHLFGMPIPNVLRRLPVKRVSFEEMLAKADALEPEWIFVRDGAVNGRPLRDGVIWAFHTGFGEYPSLDGSVKVEQIVKDSFLFAGFMWSFVRIRSLQHTPFHVKTVLVTITCKMGDMEYTVEQLPVTSNQWIILDEVSGFEVVDSPFSEVDDEISD